MTIPTEEETKGAVERLKVRPVGQAGSYQRGYDNGWNAAIDAACALVDAAIAKASRPSTEGGRS